VAVTYVMAPRGREPLYARQRAILTELVAALANDGAPRHLEPAFAADWAVADTDDARLRVVIDQVASLTDTTALAWHERLTGSRDTGAPPTEGGAPWPG
jgi:dGTPase